MYIIETVRKYSDGSIIKRLNPCNASDVHAAAVVANTYIGEWDTAQVTTRTGRVVYTVKR